jgi:hypothetical protein
LNKITSVKATKPIFLAIVLVAGIIAVLSSSFSFMTEEAKAESEYGMDSYNNKYKDDNSNAENIECSNINININTAEDNDVFSRTFNDDNNGQQLSANTFGNNERNNGFKQNDEDVLVKCIQNNNNSSSPEPQTCECFTINLDEQQIIDVERVLVATTNIPTLEEFCADLSNPDLPNENKLVSLGLVLTFAGIDVELIQTIGECLGIEFPSPLM